MVFSELGVSHETWKTAVGAFRSSYHGYCGNRAPTVSDILARAGQGTCSRTSKFSFRNNYYGDLYAHTHTHTHSATSNKRCLNFQGRRHFSTLNHALGLGSKGECDMYTLLCIHLNTTHTYMYTCMCTHSLTLTHSLTHTQQVSVTHSGILCPHVTSL